MNTDCGLKALRQCEAQLRELVAKAAASGEYEAVLKLTAWARTISLLVTGDIEPSPNSANRPSIGLRCPLYKDASQRKQVTECRERMRGKHSRRKEVLLFFAVSGFSVLIGTGLQTFLIGKVGLDTSYAFFLNAGVCLMINYAARKFFIFHG